MLALWLEGFGCSNKPLSRSASHRRQVDLVFVPLVGVDEAGRWNPAGVVASRGFMCFAAQFMANDRAPAGRDTIEPLGLHMCGWAKDNRRCSWNSQTGYKIASRI